MAGSNKKPARTPNKPPVEPAIRPNPEMVRPMYLLWYDTLRADVRKVIGVIKGPSFVRDALGDAEADEFLAALTAVDDALSNGSPRVPVVTTTDFILETVRLSRGGER